MKKTLSLIIVAVCCFVSTISAFEKPNIRAKELTVLQGERWKGTLAYRDYTSNKIVSIPVEILVTQSSADQNEWVLKYEYPKEPQANSEQNVKISDGGKRFDGGIVVSKTKLANKTLRFVTEKEGTDNDREAVFRYTYTLNQTDFSIKKEVKYKGEAIYFLRNEYKLSRAKQ